MSFLYSLLIASSVWVAILPLQAMQGSRWPFSAPAGEGKKLSLIWSEGKKAINYVHQASLQVDKKLGLSPNSTLKTVTGATAVAGLATAYTYARKSDAYGDYCKFAEMTTAVGAGLFGVIWGKRKWDLSTIQRNYDVSAQWSTARGKGFRFAAYGETPQSTKETLSLEQIYKLSSEELRKKLKEAANNAGIVCSKEKDLNAAVTTEREKLEEELNYVGNLGRMPQIVQKALSKQGGRYPTSVRPWHSHSHTAYEYVKSNPEKIPSFQKTPLPVQNPDSWFKRSIAYSSSWWQWWNLSFAPCGQQSYELYWKLLQRYMRLCLMEYVLTTGT